MQNCGASPSSLHITDLGIWSLYVLYLSFISNSVLHLKSYNHSLKKSFKIVVFLKEREKTRTKICLYKNSKIHIKKLNILWEMRREGRETFGLQNTVQNMQNIKVISKFLFVFEKKLLMPPK